MDNTESKIKKATIIREFRKQINGRSHGVIMDLDEPFFQTINEVFRYKPHNVKFHITKTNDLVFNIHFSVSKNIEVYIEHFEDGHVQATYSYGDDQPDMKQGSLKHCLWLITVFLKSKKYDCNSANA